MNQGPLIGFEKDKSCDVDVLSTGGLSSVSSTNGSFVSVGGLDVDGWFELIESITISNFVTTAYYASESSVELEWEYNSGLEKSKTIVEGVVKVETL